MKNAMVMASKNGQMDHVMRVNGETEKQTAVASCIMRMETSTKVNGQMTKLMEMELTLMQMELSMQDSGEMISNMEKVWRLGLMGQYMKACISKERRMDMEN